ncbi:MAG: COG1615 family transporter [Rhodococcus sp.]|nr:COG1615 family transporter [Rhodococcus sp. (in: high G+C Gram-positive bacteria)]
MTGPVFESRRTRSLVLVTVVLLGLLIVIPMLVGAYTNWLWFGEVCYRNVWSTVLITRVVLFFAVGLLVSGALFLAMALAYRSRPVFVPPSPSNRGLEQYRNEVLKRRRMLTIAIPLVFGFFAGIAGQTNWDVVQLFLRGGSFGTDDPQFGHDIGFYVFDLPFYEFLLNWAFIAVVLALPVNLATHYLFGGLRVARKSVVLSWPARFQLAVLAGTLILLKAVAYWLDRYALVSSSRKEPTFTGAGYTDIHAVLPAKLIMAAIAVVCAIAFVGAIVAHDFRIPALATALLVLSSILVGGVWPLLMEQFSVRPNAADVERPYIERNIAATRDAYGIGSDTVEYEPYSGVGTRPPREVPADVTTIANTRLLDPAVLSRTFTQQQQLKNFYSFPSNLDIDRYEIDGELRDYIVGARELSPHSLTGNQTDWINRHTVYTHGDGFVAAPANRVNAAVRSATGDTASSDSGYPIYTVSDIASQGTGRQIIPVDQPRIYYGEVISSASPDYAIVGTAGTEGPREYDTDATKYTYTGAGGVPIGNWFNRLAFATQYTERNILFSRAIGPESKIIFHRDPQVRVEKVAPWLTTDRNSYPAVVDGRIVWIVDAYTTLPQYPYSKRSTLEEAGVDPVTGRSLPRDEIGYARNSVKATVDAYDGTVTLYQVDDNDPVLEAWMSVFPGTVQPEDAVSDSLRAHFRYPEDLFRTQRELLAKYHVNDPREFFTNNAFWSVPSDPTVDANRHQPPFYVLVGDQETAEPSFRLASAMVGFNREFLSAYLSAHSDPDDYGRITVLQLPTDTLTQGPQQIQNSMISDTRVASERTLLERSNRIQYGNLLTLPIADGGVLYVEPLYTERISTTVDGSTFPQLSRVLVSFREPGTGGVRIGYAPTLAEALDQVFGTGTGAAATAPGGDARTAPPTEAPAPPPDVPAPAAPPAEIPPVAEMPAESAAEMAAALEDLRAAQQRGDNAAFGAALDRLLAAVEGYVEAGN